jgi:hypothetical protein
VSRLPLRYVGRPGLLGTARRWSAGSSPPVGLSHRLLSSAWRRAAGAPALNGGEQVAAPTAGQPGISGARRLAPELRRFVSGGCSRGVSGSLRVPALRSRVSARNSIECASRVELLVRHAQTLSPARPASSSARAAGNVSVHDAGGFAADLENDFATSLPRRGRAGGREFPDCF